MSGYKYRRQLPPASATVAPNATSTNDASLATITPFDTALNGVNQVKDNFFRDTIWWGLGVLAILLFLIRMYQRYSCHMRHMGGMTVAGEHQKYWARNRTSWWKVKKYLIYAPLWKKRHNLEIKLSSAINMGTLPSRLHAIMLFAYLTVNISYICNLDYTKPDKYSIVAELRGRSGVLSLVNLLPLFILAGRNNPLIPILQISFDTYNLIHRWMGRMVVLEATIHTLAWAYVKHAGFGWAGIGYQLVHDPFAGWGFVGTCALIIIVLLSPSPIRHAFYETFLCIHILLAMTALCGIMMHIKIPNLPQVPLMIAIISLWAADRLGRMARLLYYNYSSRGWTSATVEALPGNATRVTMHLPKYVDIKPGTHAYLRFSSLKVWESHPFSIAWVEHNTLASPSETEKRPSSSEIEDGVLSAPKRIDYANTTTDVSFVIHSHTGVTKLLYDRVGTNPTRGITLRAALEGPYGGHHSLDSYGTCVLFAGSSGITHQIPYLRHLIQGFTDGTVCTRKIVLVWIIRDVEHLEWVRPWMDEILRMPGRRDILTVKLFVTRPKNPREIVSPSQSVQMFPGRPDVKLLVRKEVETQMGAMCVTVCGPGGLADNVREVVREVQEDGMVDFIEESFTW
jgi:predicted ferric reductase